MGKGIAQGLRRYRNHAGLKRKEGEMFQGFYKGKRIFLTGHTGFKGSWLALWLSALGAEVAGYALPPERSHDHFNATGLAELVAHHEGDIRDGEALGRTMEGFKPHIVFHLAAQALVRRSYRDPKETFDTNVGGSVNLLEAVRRSATVKSLVFVTSDKCYKNREWLWGYRENDELGGHDPYSASKAAAELVFSSYLDSFFRQRDELGCATARAGNVIGGGDWAEDRIVPDCIRALQNGAAIELRNPGSTRPWQHVLDPLHGYLTLAMRLFENPEQYAGSWNFGPRNESIRTVQKLAECLVTHWGEGSIAARREENAPHEAGILHLSIEKAQHLLEWQPRWNFERAVQQTAQWYQQALKGCCMRTLSLGQIQDFEESAPTS